MERIFEIIDRILDTASHIRRACKCIWLSSILLFRCSLKRVSKKQQAFLYNSSLMLDDATSNLHCISQTCFKIQIFPL